MLNIHGGFGNLLMGFMQQNVSQMSSVYNEPRFASALQLITPEGSLNLIFRKKFCTMCTENNFAAAHADELASSHWTISFSNFFSLKISLQKASKYMSIFSSSPSSHFKILNKTPCFPKLSFCSKGVTGSSVAPAFHCAGHPQ